MCFKLKFLDFEKKLVFCIYKKSKINTSLFTTMEDIFLELFREVHTFAIKRNNIKRFYKMH